MADQDRTPPPDGYYWLIYPDRPAEVVRLVQGEVWLTGTGMQQKLPDLRLMGGRLLGRIPEPGQPPVAYMSPDGTRTMPAVIFDDWKAQRPDDAAGWVALGPLPKSSALPAEHIETAEGIQVRSLGGGAVAIDFDPPLVDADRRRLESALKTPQAMEAMARTGSVVAAIEAAQWKRTGETA